MRTLITQTKSQIIPIKLRPTLYIGKQNATTTRRNLAYVLPISGGNVFGHT